MQERHNVNLSLGDYTSELMYEAAKASYVNRPGFMVEMHESFSGFRAIPGSVLKDADNLFFNLGLDGVGTKIEFSERVDDHSLVAHDLFAMVCDDAVVRGAEPVAIGTILDVSRFEDTDHTRLAIEQLAEGYVSAAENAGVIIANGETAELGKRVGGYGSFNYNWGGAVIWIAHKDRILTGHELSPGDALIGLIEPGFRSNGITDVRNAMEERYGPFWHEQVVRGLGETTLGRLVQRPSIIYSKFINHLTGGFDIETPPTAKVTGVAHITGGGIPSKLGRMLEPKGLGADIGSPAAPPKIMLHVQELNRYTDEKAYSRWHMGHGMIIATPEPEKVLTEAERKGVLAKAIGRITSRPRIRVRNMGAFSNEEWLVFNRTA